MSDLGGTVETDVVLGVDGAQIKAAFDTIDARILGIQKHIDTIMQRSTQAANAFGGGLQSQIQQINKVVGALDSFQKKVLAQDPNFKKADEVNKAYAQREQQLVTSQNKRAQQEAQMWAASERAQLSTAQKIEATKERLATQRWEKERAAELQTEREVARIRDQNRMKFAKDNMQQQVAQAKSIRELENMRLASSSQLSNLRGARGQYGPDGDRQLLEAIALEKQRLALVERRIATEQSAANRYVNSDASIDGRLNVRTGRTEEQALAATLGLGAAKARQAELETRIAGQIERARTATGLEKVEAERALKVDEARLTVINSRVKALDAENQRLIRAAQPKPGTVGPPLPPGVRSPGGGGGGDGNGLFGATGVGGIFARTAAYGGAAAAIYATVGAIKDGITYSLQYEDAIAKLGAISGATTTQQEELRQTIADVGKESRFSTLDLAEAATTLAQAGFTQSEIADSLKGISQLATASGVTIAEATDVVTAAIGSFQLQASETAHINDVLASALNRTKLNIQQVALGIQYAGATAHENNISFEELTATMAVMANAGIRSGSTIGTGLRQFLVDLQTPTKKLSDELKKLGLTMNDIDINRLGLPEVLNRMAAAGFDSAAAYGNLETRAAAAYLVLRNNRQEIQEQIIAQNQIGQSADAAAKGQASLTAEWQRFKNVLNDGVENAVKPAAEALRDYLKTINDAASDETLTRLQKAYDTSGFWDVGKRQELEAQMLDYMSTVSDLTDAEAEHADEIEATTTALNKSSDEVGKQKNALKSLDDAMSRVNVRQKELSTNHLALQAEVSTLMNRFAGLARYLDGTALSYSNLTNALHQYRLEQARMLGTQLQSQGIQGRAQGAAYIRNANSIMQAGQNDGLFKGLPGNVQQMMRSLVSNPSNDILRRTLSNSASSLNGAQRKFVDDWVVSIDKGVASFRDAGRALFQSDVVGHLSHGKGAQLQSQVNDLAGKPDAVIKATITQLLKQMGGAKGASAKEAYAQLIGQAQGYIGLGNPPQAPAKKGSNAEDKAAREARRREHEDDRRESAMLQLRMKADSAELENAIKAVTRSRGDVGSDADGNIVVSRSRTLTADQLRKNIERVNEAFDEWAADRTAQVKQEIDNQNMGANDPRAKAMLDDLQREIDAHREEVNRKVGEQIVKAMDIMLKAVEDTAKRAEEAADHQQHMADARVSALGRQNLQGKVPDYVQATYERAAGRAKDDRDRAQILIQEQELNTLLQKRRELEEQLLVLQDNGITGDEDPVVARLKELNDQVTTLQNSTTELKATFGGEGLIPQSFSANMQMAIENYREVNHLTASWTDMISMNLTDALGTAQGALSQFLSDATSGTMSVQSAWKNMVVSLIKYLQQLLVKMLAVKLMQMALSAFGGPSGGSGLGQSAFPVVGGVDPLAPLLHGGQVKAYTGRYITSGVPNRDSVNAKIAKGEYVVRKSAVDSVGLDFMHALNERGSSALKAMAPKIVMPPAANQNMNVYVVAPENAPQMGPNDVVVAIAEDIYRGGTTKQLIKQVSQGA